MTKHPLSRASRNETLLLLVILAAAIALRLWGIRWGLPYLYHPDEFQVVNPYLTMVKTGDPNPHYFIYPSFPMYINAVAYGAYFLLKLVLGRFQGVEDIAFPQVLLMGTGIIADPKVYLIGRAVSMLFGLGAVYLSYRCARTISGKALPGLIAAFLTAFSAVNVTQSRLILPNIFVAFFALLTVWFSLQVLQHGRTRDYIFAGIAAGLTAACKYNGGMVALVPVAAHFLRVGWQGWKSGRLFLVAAAAALAFVLTNPFALLDFPAFWSGLTEAGASYAGGWPGASSVPLFWYLNYLWSYETLAAVAALGGVIWAIWKRHKAALVACLFPLTYFIFLCLFRYYNAHTLLHMLPTMYVLTGVFLGWLLEAIRVRFAARNRFVSVAVGALLAAALLLTAAKTISVQAKELQVNSKETARVWIEENIPTGETIAIESYSPYIDPQKYNIVVVYPFLPKDLPWYQEQGVDYLVFSQSMYKRYYADPKRYHAEIEMYERLFNALDPVKIFNDGGYEIRIYRMRASAPQP